MKPYAQVVVNVPIRRTFARHNEPAPNPFEDESANAHLLGGGEAQFQTFHYSVPIDLLDVLQVGHLVWVPFGRQELQGLVVSLDASSPVQTKPIQRLARPQPVLTQAQIQLAFWLADYYIAPLSETIKLFLPPGLLYKAERGPSVRAKREEQIELRVPVAEIRPRLLQMGRASKQVQMLEALLSAPGHILAVDDLRREYNASSSHFTKLQDLGLTERDGDHIRLVPSADEVESYLLSARGTAKFEPILHALATAEGPLWKSDLYAQVEADLSALRDLHKAGLIEMTELVRYRDPLAGRTYRRTTSPPLTEQQSTVWGRIDGELFSADAASITPARFLLHGATGSGKTEIYLLAIAETLRRNRQAIVLVPEIALTPQTVARFAGRFPGRVSVIHSELSAGERYDVWQRIRQGEIDVVVGPRSALFAPLPRLGLIVIDEEHESSYKQDAEAWGSFTVFYDARTAARQLAELTGSGLILGSATPSLESYTVAMQGDAHLLEMPRRVMGHGEVNGVDVVLYAEMPPVEIVDMRQELRADHRSIFSRSLISQLQKTVDAGEQAILFLNRRGTSTFVICRDCGYVSQCTQCDVPLTYHERADVLICHHCNRRYPIPTVCPECQSKRIKFFGSGTQRIEEVVQQYVPRARVLRWDADTTGKKGSHQEILERFAAHEADVLVGTQMIAKGLDLPLVTLVGAISTDVGLYLPDFRAPERTFQLLMQVAGRAGRSALGGRVVFQSYTPEHYAVQAAAKHDYHAFYVHEMNFRREQQYPPVRRLARLIVWDKKLEKSQSMSQQMAAVLRHRAETMGLLGEQVEILGPAPAFFARFRGYYRWQIRVRAPDPSAFLRGLDIPFGWRVDVDPMSLL